MGQNLKIIVQKFGGTSVATAHAREQAAAKIMQAKAEGYAPVVVVSAMGRRGDPYATDTLIDLARNVYPEIRPREFDLLVSCGEIISTVVMVQTLRKFGLDAVAMTGGQAGIVTDDNFQEARILGIGPDRILGYVRDGLIPIIAGFQGMTLAGDITTLGRGGSDTTATALGAALKVELVEIYTDVDGVMSVDPRVAGGARVLETMTYDEICELAHNGAKVVHPRAVEIARDAGIPVRVRNTFSDSKGTLITGGKPARVITGVTHSGGLARITVSVPRSEDDAAAKVRVFKAMSEAGISIDFVNMSSDSIIFTVKDQLADKALEALAREDFRCECLRGCAKVSVVGAGMQEVPGIVARVVEALYREGISIMQTVDSEITISCLVKEDDAPRAVRALFNEFGLS